MGKTHNVLRPEWGHPRLPLRRDVCDRNRGDDVGQLLRGPCERVVRRAGRDVETDRRLLLGVGQAKCPFDRSCRNAWHPLIRDQLERAT